MEDLECARDEQAAAAAAMENEAAELAASLAALKGVTKEQDHFIADQVFPYLLMLPSCGLRMCAAGAALGKLGSLRGKWAHRSLIAAAACSQAAALAAERAARQAAEAEGRAAAEEAKGKLAAAAAAADDAAATHAAALAEREAAAAEARASLIRTEAELEDARTRLAADRAEAEQKLREHWESSRLVTRTSVTPICTMLAPCCAVPPLMCWPFADWAPFRSIRQVTTDVAQDHSLQPHCGGVLSLRCYANYCPFLPGWRWASSRWTWRHASARSRS